MRASLGESLTHSLSNGHDSQIPGAHCHVRFSFFPVPFSFQLPNPNSTNKTLSFLISMLSLTSHHITFSHTANGPEPHHHGDQNNHHHHHHLLSKSSTLFHFLNHDDLFRQLPGRCFGNAGSQEQPQPAGMDRPGPMQVGPCQVL